MKIGDYVRTKAGRIHKITDLKGYYENGTFVKEKQLVYIDNRNSGWNYWQFEELITNSSPNIVDLIEVGDYVNGVEVIGFGKDNDYKEYLECGVGDYVVCNYYEEDIESIVTHEQFERMEYKINTD